MILTLASGREILIDNSERVRFEKFVNRSSDCWEWTAAISPDGYGIFSGSQGGMAYVARAHRISYQISVGDLSPDLQIDHLCRNRRCVNPAHLEAVTQRENILRGESLSAQRARQTHCKNGHEFTAENTYMHPKGGGRRCRTCQTAYRRRRTISDRRES